MGRLCEITKAFASRLIPTQYRPPKTHRLVHLRTVDLTETLPTTSHIISVFYYSIKAVGRRLLFSIIVFVFFLLSKPLVFHFSADPNLSYSGNKIVVIGNFGATESPNEHERYLSE